MWVAVASRAVSGPVAGAGGLRWSQWAAPFNTMPHCMLSQSCGRENLYRRALYHMSSICGHCCALGYRCMSVLLLK